MTTYAAIRTPLAWSGMSTGEKAKYQKSGLTVAIDQVLEDGYAAWESFQLWFANWPDKVLTEPHHAELYNDWASNMPWSSQLNINSTWTTSIGNYCRIVAPQDQQHTGQKNTGAWINMGSGVWGFEITISNFQILGIGMSSINRPVVTYNVGCDNSLVDKCMLTGGGFTALEINGGKGVCRNTILYRSTSGVVVNPQDLNAWYFENCVAANNVSDGFNSSRVEERTVAINCVAVLNGGNDYDRFYNNNNASNISEDLTATGTDSQTGVDPYSIFEDPDNDDYRPKAGGSLIQTGVNLYSNFQDDIINVQRQPTGSWERGAFTVPSSPVIVSNPLFFGQDF